MCRWFDSAPGHQFMKTNRSRLVFSFLHYPHILRGFAPFCLCFVGTNSRPDLPVSCPVRFFSALCSQKMWENPHYPAHAERLDHQSVVRVSRSMVRRANWCSNQSLKLIAGGKPKHPALIFPCHRHVIAAPPHGLQVEIPGLPAVQYGLHDVRCQ